jgi:hypothetical protein
MRSRKNCPSARSHTSSEPARHLPHTYMKQITKHITHFPANKHATWTPHKHAIPHMNQTHITYTISGHWTTHTHTHIHSETLRY